MYSVGGIKIIRWKKELELGIKNIDDEHKEFFVKAHGLLNNLKSNDEKVKQDSAEEFLAFLENYIKYHFKAEEEYQISIDYPDYREHKEKHENFIMKVEEIINELDKESADYNIYLELHNTILGWFSDHICYVDYRIKEFLDKQ